jgi:hypothetical protein
MNKKAHHQNSLSWKLRNIISLQPGEVKRRDLSNFRHSEIQLEFDLPPRRNFALQALSDPGQPR